MKTKLARSLLTATLTLSTALLTSGCAHSPVIIPADREVTWLKAGQPAPQPGYLVPEARMLEILDRLGEQAAKP